MVPGAEPEGSAGPSESTSREPAGLAQIREAARALLEQGKVEEAWEMMLSAVEAVLTKNRELELLVAKLRRERAGSRSEQVDPHQLWLLLEALREQGGGQGQQPIDLESEARQDAELDRQIEEAERAGAVQRKGRPKGAEWQARRVERIVHEVEIPESERQCSCGRLKKDIGVDISRRLHYVPGHFEQHEYRLHKYGCDCKEGVLTAPAPPQVLDRSAAGETLLGHVVVSKYSDHTPLHRLSGIYARSGALIPVSTLSDWVAGTAKLLVPLYERLEQRVLRAYIVRTDSTGLKVLDPLDPQNIHRGSMWVYVGDDRDVLFRYTPTGEGATGPWEFLAGRTGYIQADAASVFDRLFNGEVASAVELGCWAHGRRRLTDLQDTDCRAAYPLKLIGRLYRIEHLADARGLGPEERAALRQERSMPELDKLKRWMAITARDEPPASDLAKAASYTLNHWEALTRFVEDGRVSLDNNLAEQQLRDVALGRKNYLFAGSHEAARRAAVLYSLTRTCAQYGVPPLEFFTDVLAKLANGWEQKRLDELLPHRWRTPGTEPRSSQGP